MKGSIVFSGLLARVRRPILVLLALANAAFAQLPALKQPVLSYYTEPSPPGFLNGGWYATRPSGATYDVFRRDQYQLQPPVHVPATDYYAVVKPLKDGRILQATNITEGGYAKVKITTQMAGESAVLTRRDVPVWSYLEPLDACVDYAVMGSRNQLYYMPLATSETPVVLDLTAIVPQWTRIDRVVAGGAWFAVAVTDLERYDLLHWHVFRSADFEPIGNFVSEGMVVWNDVKPSFALAERYLALCSRKQLQFWDMQNLSAGPQKIDVGGENADFEDAQSDGIGLWTVEKLEGTFGPREVRYYDRGEDGRFCLCYRAESDATFFEAWQGGLAAEDGVALYRFQSTGRTQVYDRASSEPLLSLSQGEWAEEASGKASFLLTLDEPAKQACSVRVVVRSGTATADQDFQPRDFRVSFAAGEQAVSVEVALVKDLIPENHETILVDLIEPEGLKVVKDGNPGLVIRASGFELDQSRVFSGIPEGWEKPRVDGLTENYVIATLQRPSQPDGHIPGYQKAVFDLKHGGFITFASTEQLGAPCTEVNGELGSLGSHDSNASFQLTRWNPRSDAAPRTSSHQRSAIGSDRISNLVWVGGEKLVGVALTVEALDPGSGDLTFQHLTGVEVNGQLPMAAHLALGNRYLAVVALYGQPSIGHGIVYQRRVHLFDRTTLAKLWSVDLGATEDFRLGVEVSTDRVVVCNDDRLIGLDVATGVTAWDRRPYPSDRDRQIELKAAGRDHAFFTSQPYGSLEVIELSTGMCLGPLKVGDLFEANATIQQVLANESGTFVARGFAGLIDDEFKFGSWVELKSERTRPALLFDPAVLALSYGGAPISIRFAEQFDRPIEVEIGKRVDFGTGTVSPSTGWATLTVPADGSGGMTWLDLSPSEAEGWNRPVSAVLAGRIIADGQPVLEESAKVPAIVAVPTIAKTKTQLAVDVNFSGARSMVEEDGELFVGFPEAGGDGLPGSGKVEVFNAANGAHLRTIMRPAQPVSVSFGARLLMEQGKLLVASPGWAFSKKAKKTGLIHIVDASTGTVTKTIANPTDGIGFGSTLASSAQYFAVGAVNHDPYFYKAKNTVTLFRWSDFKKVCSVTGDAFAQFGESMALHGSELLVGSPGTTLQQGKTIFREAGRVQSFTLPKGKAGADWISPWVATERHFGLTLLSGNGSWVIGSGYGGSIGFQMFDSVRGIPRFLLKPYDREYFRTETASLHRDHLVMANFKDLVLASLQDGSVPLEARLTDNDQPALENFLYALDANSNLLWIDGSRLYRSDSEDLGGFAWWAHTVLPQGEPVSVKADANSNGVSDLLDYVAARAGALPVSATLDGNGQFKVVVSEAFPRDVSISLSVLDQAGNWLPLGTWVAGMWVGGSDLASGIAPDESWGAPLQYRVEFDWLGRRD